ncbi:alpha/beta hydrolase [Ruicaihuangia caeni]|uniref:alpha/beta hydrolase n=1 Tax=Ruicaihuangia caeni TaxID=3042517 RepID=UPI00338D4946
MADRTITFDSNGTRFEGTLALPAGDAPHPAALIIPGSGPVDRDSSIKQLPLDITRQLAEALRERGIATLRYDKRGVGASGGEFLSAGFYEGVTDAAAALDALRNAPEVDADRVIVVGHSEGALVAGELAAGWPVATRCAVPAAAANGATGGASASDEVAASAAASAPASIDALLGEGTAQKLRGVVLLSASAQPGKTLLAWQAAKIAPSLPGWVRFVLKLMRTDLVEKSRKTHEKIGASTADVMRIEGRKLNAKWMREFVAHDPSLSYSKITVPVLAITGEKDLQTPVGDLEVIRDCVAGPVETVAMPKLSHILRTQEGEPSIADYRKDVKRPVDAELLARVADWSAETLGA